MSNTLSVSKTRVHVLKSAQYRCTQCSSTDRLHIHHIDKNRKNNEVTNLQVLCLACHNKIHHTYDQGRSISFNLDDKINARFRKYLTANRSNSYGSVKQVLEESLDELLTKEGY